MDTAILAAAGAATLGAVLIAVLLSESSPFVMLRDALMEDPVVTGVLLVAVVMTAVSIFFLAVRRRRRTGATRTWVIAALCVVAVATSASLLIVPAGHASELAAAAERARNERAVARWEQWSAVGKGNSSVLSQDELHADFSELEDALLEVLAEPVIEDSQFPFTAEPNPQDCGDYEYPGVRYENLFSFSTADDAASWAAIDTLLRSEGFFIEATADTLVASGTYHRSVAFVSLVGPGINMPGTPWLTLTISGKCGVADE